MAGDIGERLLGHAIEHGPHRDAGFLNLGKDLEAGPDAGFAHGAFHE
jgi:hypothetical protein